MGSCLQGRPRYQFGDFRARIKIIIHFNAVIDAADMTIVLYSCIDRR